MTCSNPPTRPPHLDTLLLVFDIYNYITYYFILSLSCGRLRSALGARAVLFRSSRELPSFPAAKPRSASSGMHAACFLLTDHATRFADDALNRGVPVGTNRNRLPLSTTRINAPRVLIPTNTAVFLDSLVLPFKNCGLFSSASIFIKG